MHFRNRRDNDYQSAYLTTCGLTATFTFDLLSQNLISSSSPSNCTEVKNLVNVPTIGP